MFLETTVSVSATLLSEEVISNTCLPAVRVRSGSFTLPPILYGVPENNKETAVAGTLEVLLKL